jgi:phage terminase large subunit-like protein
MTGSKPVIVLIDELHVMSAYSYASRVVGQIRGGMIANPESLLIFITTQSDTAPAGVFASELGYARKVRDGEIVDNVRTLPILYEFPPEIQRDETEPWRDPAMWSMVNPNLGLSITLDRLIDGFNQAVEKGLAALREWASQHLNIEIGLALSQTAWVGALYWERAADTTLTLETLLARSEVVTVGVDGGGLDDLLGLAVLGRERETRRWLCWARAWAFVSVLERRQSEAERLRSLAAAGDLVIFDRPGQDTEEMIEIVSAVEAAGLLANVGADRVGLQFCEELSAIGVLPGERLFSIPQGYMLMGAIKTVERKLADGTFRHAGQPLMAWSVGNAKIEPRGNAVMITKQAAGTAKIDPLMALFDAVYLMSKNPAAPRKPEYQMIVV